MASATATDDSRPLPFESLPLIDLRLLTQSELYSLSLLSVSSPAPSSQDDVVVPIPKIDRSVFNESAGSRKQTYFRLRLASRTTSNPLHPSAHVSRQKTPEPFEEENSRIISLLKDLFAHHTEPEPPLPTTPEDEGSLIAVPVTYDECVPESSNSILQSIPIGVLDIKFSIRKRGRPRKHHTSENFSDGKEDLDSEDKEEENPTERASPMAACDLDSFEEELKKRTQGMRTEEELSGFLRGLSGEWGSRKKKRKIVDARCLGDVLPIGWKLLLSIKSDGDRAWLGCSRYISPDGLQFVSSKDVSAHLLSSFGVQDASHENSGPANESSWLTCRMTSENSADPTLQMERNQDEVVCLSAVPISSIPAYHHTEAPLSMGGSLGNSQTKESYRCHKCTMTFEEKDNLLLHLLSSHKKSRNTSNGAKNSDSVIMKEGKYECQLCHKLFEEKNRFSSHFGNHIKDYVKRVEASGETNRAHKRTPKVQEMIASGRLSRAVLENTEAVEKGHLNLPHSIIETGAIAKTQSRSDGHHVNIHPIEPVATMSEKNEEHVAEYAQKHERYSGLSNDYIGVVDEADKIDSELNVSKDLMAVSSTAHTNKASETPEKLNAYNSENKVNMNSVITMEDCGQEMVPVSRVFSATENNKSINNESLVNSLFGSPVEDMDVDDGDGIEDNELLPGIEDRCLGLAEGIPDSGKQKISSERCSLVQFVSKEKSVNADDLTGTQTSILEKESHSENCLPSSGQVRLANDSQGKVIGGSLQEHGSFNSWNGEKAINFGQHVADRSVQEVGSGFPVIPAVNKQTREFDENLKGFSVPKLQKTWQQEAFESNVLSAHQKSLSADVNSGKISDTIRNLQSLAQSRSDSPVLNHFEKERSSEGTLPVASLDQKAFVLNTHEAQVPTVNKPKECRGFTGLYAGDHNSVDKSSENLTVSNTVHTPKQGQSLGSNWNDKSSFGIDCRHPLQHGGPVMGFEAWANPPSRSSEVAIPEYRRASPFGSAIEELKRNKESAFGLLSRSVDHQQACVTGYNPDMFRGGALLDNHQAGNLETFRNNEQMIGLYSQQQHKHHGEAVARSMLGEEQNFSILHNSNLNYVSQSAAQPSHSFPAFNLAPDKVQNEFYASNEKLGDTPAVAGGVRVGSSGSFMEYNFLSATPSAQGSRISSFNQQMGQGLESNWIEKEASGLFSKMGSGAGGSSGSRHHQVTALCVWCGNQFSNEGDFDVGDGSVGYMCFNCKAKFAGQINFF